MMTRCVVDPMTRIEGHLRFVTHIENQVVIDAQCSADMFRGIEKALIGYDARVAQQVTQRICGVCPYGHAEAAALALEHAMNLRPNANGQRLRNLIVGSYHLQDYLLHFYALCALDFIDITAVLHYQGQDAGLLTVRDWVKQEMASAKVFPAAPFLPRYEAAYCHDPTLNLSAIRHYLEALPIMATLHRMVALFGAKAPHPVTIEAGGVTTIPSLDSIIQFRTWLIPVAAFIRGAFRDDVTAVAQAFRPYFAEGRGAGHLLSYPFFPDATGANHAFAGGATLNGQYQPLDINKITEDSVRSYYSDQPDRHVKPLSSRHLTPIDWAQFNHERAQPNGKYSWARAPRYGGAVMEVGPVARIVNTYHAGINPAVTSLVNQYNQALGLTLADYPSVMGRHLARLFNALLILDRLEQDLEALVPDQLGFIEQPVPRNAQGVGLTEATRGALAHWIATDDQGYIQNYELIVPTTWNISPRDASNQPGAVEQMLIGTRIQNSAAPIELTRIVRSTDPCIACSVH
ncbi:nickel-dependent hydrogenase large subunit [Rhodoferax sp. 4810]|uniref:Uptake hydrogenase large subunit n=1 Tax=Thiospirillum jenense TaxID=1653858 RepID=A0A839HIH7_9GAMM|nr:nickel-dependent hydrogenase large subunit [Thiospirillum jenense]MBB1074535.1 nickel-dependent hydrogenase large subunit [Rhodoferax jenense]MBB1126509.1 nickel-dependent hydrogenase large subunit [Thiospirillum jenense]